VRRRRGSETSTNDGCKVALAGGAVSVAIAHTALPNGRNSYVNFPRDAGGGRIVFEGSWPLDGNQPPETIWQRTGADAPTVAVARTFDNSVSPCVLGDSRLAILWLGRPGSGGVHELTVIATDGTTTTITPDTDVFDIGIGCTSR